MKTHLAILAITLHTLSSFADTEVVDGVPWNYDVWNGEASIGNQGSAFSSTFSAVSIPESLGGYPVTCIGVRAFYGCTELISVTIHDGVTRIQNRAFYGCSKLTSLTIPNGVTCISSSVFAGCSGLKSITIPDGVTIIMDSAFSACSGLTSITIPENVMSIGNSAFSYCSKLASITIPDNVMSIGTNTFYRCASSLFDDTSISGIRLVDGWVVGHANSLSGSIDLTGVRGIADFAFFGCSGLTSITVPDGVKRIGQHAFDGCSGIGSFTIPNSVTSVGNDAFQGCSGLTSITISDSVTSVEERAFSGCSGLTSITIPDSVTNIGYNAFSGCSGLGTVVIPGSARISCKSLPSSITNAAVLNGSRTLTTTPFRFCANLKTITVPRSVTNIAQNAFSGCSGLETVFLPVRFVGKTDSLGVPSGCQIVCGTDIEGESGLTNSGKPLSFRSDAETAWWEWVDASVPDGACLRSGSISTNDESALLVQISGAGRLSFDWKISAGRGDACAFVLDGVEKNIIQRSSSWKSVSVDLGAGNHVLQWIYRRGTGSATGEDAAFVDNVDWRPNLSLQVSSAFGTPDPEEGTHAFVYGDSVAATIAEPEPETGVRRVFTGWTGTGSVPASGTAPAVSFVVTNDSSLAWNWRTEYPLALSVSGPATADFADGWVESGTTKVVHWTPTVPYFDVAISGDTSGVVLDRDERTLSIPANRARNVTLAVTERVIDFTAVGPVTTDFAEVWGEDADELIVQWTSTVPYFKVSLSGDTNGVALDEGARMLTIPTTRSRTFSLVVEELTLERALDTEGLAWTTDGADVWFPQLAVHSDGEDAAQSGALANGDEWSGLETTLDGPGTITWTWRISSADNAGVDVLLDGEWLEGRAPGVEWSDEELVVSGDGEHIVRFEFWNASGNADIRAWIDQVSWTGGSPFGARLSLVSFAQEEAAFSVVSFMGDRTETMHRTLELATDGHFGTIAKTIVLEDTTTNTSEQVAISGLSPGTDYWARVRVSLSNGEVSVSETVSFATTTHVAPVLGSPVSDARAVNATVSVPLEALGSDGGAVSVSVAVTVLDTGMAAGTAAPETLAEPGTARIEVSGLAPQTVYRFVATARSVATGLSSSVSGGFATDWGETPLIAAGGSGLGNLPALCFLPSATGAGEDFVVRIDNPVPGCWYPVYTNGTPAGRFAVQSCAMPESAEGGYIVRVPADAVAKFVKIGISKTRIPPGTIEGLTPTFIVSFDSAGGSAVASITAPYGSALVEPTAPTKEGYDFAGWVPAFPATMPDGGATLTAQWTPENYTITFDSAGGSSIASITAPYGSALVEPAAPTLEGCVFAGWVPAFPATMPLNGATLTAQWTPKNYTIAFDSAGGSSIASITAPYGSALVEPAAPTLEGYVFAGWVPAFPATMPLNGATLTAQWMSAGEANFNWTVSGNSVKITGVKQNPTGEVTIPAEIEGHPVTDIGNSAFANCSGMTSITIPASVTSINASAFNGCSGLSEVHISDLAAWCSISFGSYNANPCYYSQRLFLNGEEITDLVVPDGAMTIKNYAFRNCTRLSSITIPASVTSIGVRAFERCSGLTSIAVSSGNTVYDSRNNCNAIIQTSNKALVAGCQNTIIPSGVKSIGIDAFHGRTGLTAIEIPTSVTSIGQDAFYGCSGLTSITIPDSVTSIGSGVFHGCSRLATISIPSSLEGNTSSWDIPSSCQIVVRGD